MAQDHPQMHELFAQIGNRLKVAREEAGYSLQDLSAETRINLLFLQRIETGDLDALPGLAFVKGFIRNYIQVLQIADPELDEELRRLSQSENAGAGPQIQPSNPYVLETDETGVSYVRLALFAALAVLIVWVGYMLLRGSDGPMVETAVTPPAVTAPAPAAGPAARSTEPVAPPAGAPATPPPAAASVGTPPAPPKEPAAPATAPPRRATVPRGAQTGPPARPGAPPEGRQKLELTIRGLERTWVRLSVDRAPPIDVLLQPAETVAWEANQEIRLTIGKSHGVAVYLNGEEILLPQESNRLIPNLVLNKLTLLRLEN